MRLLAIRQPQQLQAPSGFFVVVAKGDRDQAMRPSKHAILGRCCVRIKRSIPRTCRVASTRSTPTHLAFIHVTRMRPEERVHLSKRMSMVLRHRAAEFGLAMDASGYVAVADLLGLSKFRGASPDNVLEVVQHDEKQRYSTTIRDGALFVRANQGHSIAKVDDEALLAPIDSAEQAPVWIHGTYLHAWPSIRYAPRIIAATTADSSHGGAGLTRQPFCRPPQRARPEAHVPQPYALRARLPRRGAYTARRRPHPSRGSLYGLCFRATRRASGPACVATPR